MTGDRPNRPSDGHGYPKVGGKDEKKPEPIEVYLKAGTLKRIILWVLGPLLATLITAISAFFYFYHQTNTHISDQNIHLEKGERKKIAAEAKKERKAIKEDIKGHVDVKVREVKVEQKELLQESTRKLQRQQRRQYENMMQEIRKAR
jgi:hypothetical protein